MTHAIFSQLPGLLICLLLSGCTLPVLNMSTVKDADRFAQGLDQYLESGDLTTLQQLQSGEWRVRAEGIIALDQHLQQRQTQLEQKDKLLASCQNDTKLTLCQKEKEALATDKKALEKTLKRLKNVLIDTELRAK